MREVPGHSIVELRGDIAEGRLDGSTRSIRIGLFEWYGSKWIHGSISPRSDPRFQHFLRRMNFPE